MRGSPDNPLPGLATRDGEDVSGDHLKMRRGGENAKLFKARVSARRSGVRPGAAASGRNLGFIWFRID